jgi:predicted house-cleaning noncanonical NTP pyrophosphatase (MazG superfamily)
LGQKYNKAIRDRIPEIIRERGEECEVRQLSDIEFLLELEKKLDEEVTEYNQSKDLEELADILEVVYRIGELKGVSSDKLDKIRSEKNLARGSFRKNLFLIETKRKPDIQR